MARLGYSGSSYYSDDSANKKQKEELKQLINKDMLQKQLDEMLLQKAGLTKVSSGSYKNLTSLPIEDLKAQLVGQTQNNNTPVVQQDIKQQLSKPQAPAQQNVVQPPVDDSQGLMGFSLQQVEQAIHDNRGTNPYSKMTGLDEFNFNSDIKDPQKRQLISKWFNTRLNDVPWLSSQLKEMPELIWHGNTLMNNPDYEKQWSGLSPEDKANQILADRLENHYGGSRYTEDQMKAASEVQAAQLKSQAEQEKIDNAFKMQELKNQGLTESAGAKAGKGGLLPMTQLDNLSKNVAAIKGTDDLLKRIDENKDQFGFITGGINANIPWNVTGRDLQASMEKVAYELWRQIDPRLSEQDAKRAAKQVGGLNDPVELVTERINNLKKEALRKLNEDVTSYNGYGYTIPQNVSDFINSQQKFKDTVDNAQANIENTNSINIPEKAKQYLLQNPSLASQFDAKYGNGASASILGGN